jgi:alpha/beta superfamily hydrolase
MTSRSVVVDGPAGAIEALIESPLGTASGIAVLCHPHPLHQGTMHNKVVTTMARTFTDLGAIAVRFNFRGVGASGGAYADGIGERDDVIAVARWSRTQWPDLPLYLGGFSFGAAVALSAAAELMPSGLVTVAPPPKRIGARFTQPTCPWLLVQGDKDDVVSSDEVLAWARALPRPPTLAVLADGGHFFHGRLRELAAAVAAFFAPQFARDESVR